MKSFSKLYSEFQIDTQKKLSEQLALRERFDRGSENLNELEDIIHAHLLLKKQIMLKRSKFNYNIIQAIEESAVRNNITLYKRYLTLVAQDRLRNDIIGTDLTQKAYNHARLEAFRLRASAYQARFRVVEIRYHPNPFSDHLPTVDRRYLRSIIQTSPRE